MIRIILCIVLLLCLGACSGSDEKGEEKGAIKQKTDQIAAEAVDYIKVPIEQAKDAANDLEAHARTIQDAREKNE